MHSFTHPLLSLYSFSCFASYVSPKGHHRRAHQRAVPRSPNASGQESSTKEARRRKSRRLLSLFVFSRARSVRLRNILDVTYRIITTVAFLTFLLHLFVRCFFFSYAPASLLLRVLLLLPFLSFHHYIRGHFSTQTVDQEKQPVEHGVVKQLRRG